MRKHNDGVQQVPASGGHSLALGCIGAMIGTTIAAGTAFGGAGQSWLYPPEVRVRPVVVVIGAPLQRRYWDPRYCRSLRTSAGAALVLPPGRRDR